MRRHVILVVIVLLATGCASRGEGLTINRDGLHVGTSLAKRDQIAQIVKAAPALDAPRLQELQGRVGDRGMRLLAERGEIEETLALMPDPELTETEEEVNHD